MYEPMGGAQNQMARGPGRQLEGVKQAREQESSSPKRLLCNQVLKVTG